MQDDAIKQELEPIAQQNQALVADAEAIEVKNETDVLRASKVLTEVKITANTIEEKRKEITQPLNQSLRRINDIFRNVSAPFAAAEAKLKVAVKTWIDDEEAAAEKEENRRRKIQESHAAKGHNTSLPAYIDRPDRTIGNIQIRKVLTFEVTDPTLVPKEFWSVDETLVKQAVAEGAREVPGIKIGYENVIAVVTK